MPWGRTANPLMLAPMQGLTNRELRALFIKLVRPDVVFTEFVRVRAGSRKVVSDIDRLEAGSREGDVPLVVQLIGRDTEALVAGAEIAQECGAEHLNINMGCPYGRMNMNSAGGALLRNPVGLPETLAALRRVVHGTFSVKLRAGYEDPEQVFSLLPVFEGEGVDFLIMHPRTVKQKFLGRADHAITTRVVEACRLPVVANGDINTAAEGQEVLAQTRSCGLMLGRGAMNDPYLFARLRGEKPTVPSQAARAEELRNFITELADRYRHLFFGEDQVLRKLKEVLVFINEPVFFEPVRDLKRAKKLDIFISLIEHIQ